MAMGMMVSFESLPNHSLRIKTVRTVIELHAYSVFSLGEIPTNRHVQILVMGLY